MLPSRNLDHMDLDMKPSELTISKGACQVYKAAVEEAIDNIASGDVTAALGTLSRARAVVKKIEG